MTDKISEADLENANIDAANLATAMNGTGTWVDRNGTTKKTYALIQSEYALIAGTSTTGWNVDSTNHTLGFNCTPVASANIPVRIEKNGAANAGIEFGWSSSTLFTVLSYNRASPGYTDLGLDGANLRFSISGTEKARLDSSGNLGIGMTPAEILDITKNTSGTARIKMLNSNSGTSAALRISLSNGTGTGDLFHFGASYTTSGINLQDGTLLAGNGAGGLTLSTGTLAALRFAVNNTQVGAFDTSGNFNCNLLAATNSGASGSTILSNSTGGSFAGIGIKVTATRNTTNGSYDAIGYFNTTAAEWRFEVLDSGNVQNKNNSYGAISDIKLKQDIVLAGSQWSDIKAIGGIVSKYRFKSDPAGPLHIGVIAQDLEEIAPGLVDTIQDRDGNGSQIEGQETKTVKYSVLYMKAVKALGEALDRIEALEARVAALETP